MKQMLSVEQSAELIKRGVSKDKASEKERVYKPVMAQNGVVHNIYVSDVPTFTLADLLSLLPVDVYHKPKTYDPMTGTTKWETVSEYSMRAISDILDKHDNMIREEIEEEIAEIERQIEAL